MSLEFAQRIARIPVYPAADGYALDDDVAMLASNETPFAPLPEVLEAARRAVGTVNRYPDPGNGELRGALSRRHGVPAARIAIGNGSCDVLLAAAEALLEPGAELVHAWPSFSMYPHLAAASGATAVTVPLDEQERHDLPALARAVTVATRMLVVCNPNNPTSTAVPVEEIAALLRDAPPSVCVVLDEAYREFVAHEDPDATVDLLDEHPNLVLLRTFSKVYGLAGLRVGYALCGSEAFRSAVDQVRQPFFSNVAAQAAAVEALRHQDEVARRVEQTIAARLELEEGLRALGIQPADSEANFVWFALPEQADEAEVVKALAGRKVLVRAGGALGRERCLRVTCGRPEENARFLAALRDCL
ncbi:MAG: histidinol-phosphate aminotransferase [Solirubrobacteraceae bacterium]|jgi:histidinol-phosphate aminotransferase|nr:histidinol-phosphate aminotransferase [Solirubrobacteraceae bacterium]